MEIGRTLYVKDRATWRKWLIKNHLKAKEVWLIYYKKVSGQPRIPYYDAVDEALCFGWIDSTVKTLDKDQYVQRFSPRRAKSYWSATNTARYQKLFKQGLVGPAGRTAFLKKAGIVHQDRKPGAYAWHLNHRLPPKPTPSQRLAWHKAHQKNCGCRPIPASLLPKS